MNGFFCFVRYWSAGKWKKANVARSEAEEKVNAIARCHRELQQRERLAVRLAGRLRPALTFEDYGLPLLDEME